MFCNSAYSRLLKSIVILMFVAGLTRSPSSNHRWTKASSDSTGRLCHHAIWLFRSKLRHAVV